MDKVSVDTITTNLEVTERSAEAPDMQRVVELVMQRLRQDTEFRALRDADNRINDRSWRSDVKPD